MQERIKREEDERIKAEAAESALTEAIKAAAEKRAQQEKEEKEREREREKEREKERERDRAAKDLKMKGNVPGGNGIAGKGKGGDTLRGGVGTGDGFIHKKGGASVIAPAGGAGAGVKKCGDIAKKVEKLDPQEMLLHVSSLVTDGQVLEQAHEIVFVERKGWKIGILGCLLSKTQSLAGRVKTRSGIPLEGFQAKLVT
jgi:hypothetical protein